jgi:hypothetical protein
LRLFLNECVRASAKRNVKPIVKSEKVNRMKGHYVINCNNKQNGKPRVCKNYFSKKHKSHRKKWAEKHGKYQNKPKRKKPIITSDVPQHIVVAPPATGAKIKKRITPTLISSEVSQQPQVFGGSGGNNLTTGQQRMNNTINKMEKQYTKPEYKYDKKIAFKI